MSRSLRIASEIVAFSQAFMIGWFIAEGEPLMVVMHGALWGLLRYQLTKVNA
jgi:hypothetical protein